MLPESDARVRIDPEVPVLVALLLAIAGLVLLIACANVANLLAAPVLQSQLVGTTEGLRLTLQIRGGTQAISARRKRSNCRRGRQSSGCHSVPGERHLAAADQTDAPSMSDTWSEQCVEGSENRVTKWKSDKIAAMAFNPSLTR